MAAIDMLIATDSNEILTAGGGPQGPPLYQNSAL